MKVYSYILFFLVFISCESPQKEVNTWDSISNSKLFSLNDSLIQTYDLSGEIVSSIPKKEYNRIAILNTPFYAYFSSIAKKKVVGVFNKSRLRQHYGNFESLGDGAEIDLEKLIAVQPDLIICNSYQLDVIKSLDLPKLVIDEYLENGIQRRRSFYQIAGAVSNKLTEAKVAANNPRTLINEFPSLNKTVLKLDNFGGEYFKPGEYTYIAEIVRYAGGELMTVEGKSESVKIPQENAIVDLANAEYLIFMDWELSKEGLMDRLSPILLKNHPKKLIYCNTSQSNYFFHSLVNSRLIINDLNSILSGEKVKGGIFELINLEE